MMGINEETAVSYWRQNERTARFTALGIATLIASPGVATGTTETARGCMGGASVLPGGLFLVLAAVGIVLLLIPWLDRRHQHRHQRVAIAPATQALAGQERRAYRRAHTIGLLFGIGMCLVSLAAPSFFAGSLGATLFLFGEAIGIFFIVYVNLVAKGYTRLMHDHASLR